MKSPNILSFSEISLGIMPLRPILLLWRKWQDFLLFMAKVFYQCQLSGKNKRIWSLQMLYCGHFTPETLLWWMKGLTGKRGRKGKEKERKIQAAWVSQEVTWGSHPGTDLSLFPAHVSLFIVLYLTRKLNFSLLMFLLESSCAIPAGNSNTTNPNVFYTVQRVKGKTELLR